MFGIKNLSFKKLVILFLILLAIPATVFLATKVTYFFGRAFGTPANLVIDTGISFDIPSDVWRNLAQGGEEKGQSLTSVVGKVKGLYPQYIRIDHLYDSYDVVSKDGGGNLSFNWEKLDATVRDILATGALPYLSLSYMPPTISAGSVTDLPKNWADWEQIVQRTVEHYSGKNGLNLSNVYYEVWNEPDLFGEFKTYGNKSYFELYSHSVQGAQRAQNVNTFKIGGPATTGLYENWFKGFLKYVSDNALRLDFYSWHKYSKEVDNFYNNYTSAKGWLREYPNFSTLELIISEIGPNSENDPMYDNNIGAIHVLAQSAVLEGNISKTFIFEIKDGPGQDKFWGRWGILTHEKFGDPQPKPRFFALNFLNQMSGKRLNLAGMGSWVKAFAKDGNGKIKTLVVNYDPSGKHSEAVPIEFINLPYRLFSFKRTDFLGKEREYVVATDSARWATVEEFSPNSAAIFTITPK